mgnify:CR=1 FL=1
MPAATLTGYEALSRPFRYVLEYYPAEQPELAARYSVSRIPTVLVFKDGKVAASSVGYRPRPQIEALLG